MFRMVIAQGRSPIYQRDEMERPSHARLVAHVDYQLLRKIPGIGPINPLTILTEQATFAASAIIASSSSSAASSPRPASPARSAAAALAPASASFSTPKNQRVTSRALSLQLVGASID